MPNFGLDNDPLKLSEVEICGTLKFDIFYGCFLKILNNHKDLNMKRNNSFIALIFSAIISFITFDARAQSAFAGFYGQISTGYEGNQLTNITGSSVETPSIGHHVSSTAPSQSFGGAPIVLGLGNYWQLNSSWLLGVGADYSALSQTSSPWQANVTNTPGNNLIPSGSTMTSNGSTLKLSNRLNFFISPGYVIDKDKLVYLKAGYSQVTAQGSRATSVTVANASGVNSFPTTTAGTGASSTVSGYLIGLGYKQTVAGGLYGFVEGNYMGYGNISESYNAIGNSASKTAVGVTNSNVTTISRSQNLNSYQFLVGIGYKF
jgi:hypothetical protein